jgi:hypothetical protein
VLENTLLKRTTKFWNQLPAEALVTVHYKLHIFRKRVSEEKQRGF